MPTEAEVVAYASSHASFYELLHISDDTQTTNIKKAYRKTALKYHPDKNPDDPAAASKFHLLTDASDILCDPALRAVYDKALSAKVAVKKRNEAYDNKRRKMKEDLEGRETQAKRTKIEEDEHRRELERLKEEGARLRQKMNEKKRKETESGDLDLDEDPIPHDSDATQQAPDSYPVSQFTELDRTVTVKWRNKGQGEEIDRSTLLQLFGRFGKIEECVIAGGKSSNNQAHQDKEKKYRSAVLIYDNIAHAYNAVHHNRASLLEENKIWILFRDVLWASGREPDLGLNWHKSDTGAYFVDSRDTSNSSTLGEDRDVPFNHETHNAFHTPLASKQSGFPNTPTEKANDPSPSLREYSKLHFTPKKYAHIPDIASTPISKLHKVPSFASFRASSAFNTPQQSPASLSKSIGTNSPDYESITMMKMRAKAAEKRKLEDDIRRREQKEEEGDVVV